MQHMTFFVSPIDHCDLLLQQSRQASLTEVMFEHPALVQPYELDPAGNLCCTNGPGTTAEKLGFETRCSAGT